MSNLKNEQAHVFKTLFKVPLLKSNQYINEFDRTLKKYYESNEGLYGVR